MLHFVLSIFFSHRNEEYYEPFEVKKRTGHLYLFPSLVLQSEHTRDPRAHLSSCTTIKWYHFQTFPNFPALQREAKIFRQIGPPAVWFFFSHSQKLHFFGSSQYHRFGEQAPPCWKVEGISRIIARSAASSESQNVSSLRSLESQESHPYLD